MSEDNNLETHNANLVHIRIIKNVIIDFIFNLLRY